MLLLLWLLWFLFLSSSVCECAAGHLFFFVCGLLLLLSVGRAGRLVEAWRHTRTLPPFLGCLIPILRTTQTQGKGRGREGEGAEILF
ncbi:hypothetical protein TRSC58_07475 [Trypanosoma rangeli SC58]|uniref:Secreted protein n=1 Tax=Trypanosoma rangeli SC58 TaxID=429131 RepID=A0A061IT32_TRYRA|nr:hypothetical protein TRSC58_07475 [Trypanosoma rangeli SC58]